MGMSFVKTCLIEKSLALILEQRKWNYLNTKSYGKLSHWILYASKPNAGIQL